jgi:hypothetical protein
MDPDLLTRLLPPESPTAANDASGLDSMQRAVDLYEQTLRLMGVVPYEVISQAVDNAQVVYSEPTSVVGPTAGWR